MRAAKIPFAPLLDRWLRQPGESKASFARALNVSPANVTNWLRRGIPPKELPRAAAKVGVSVDGYLQEVGLLKALPVAQSEPLPAELVKIIEEWPSLMPDEQKLVVADVMAKAEYNRSVVRKLGIPARAAEDGRVESAYKLPEPQVDAVKLKPFSAKKGAKK